MRLFLDQVCFKFQRNKIFPAW